MPERFTGHEGMDWKAPKKETEKVEAPAKFHEASTVNGVQISVGWDRGNDKYRIFFPQIDLSKGRKRGVSDQVLGLTRRPEVAKQVYEKAVELAKTTPDVYELYKKIEALQSGLQYDTDEDEADQEMERKTPEKKSGPDTSFYQASKVNGTEISVGWDRGNDVYRIFFPQIDLSKGRKRGVSDQVLGLTRRPEVAKQVYDKAVELAKMTTDVYELYKQIETFSRGLSYNEE